MGVPARAPEAAALTWSMSAPMSVPSLDSSVADPLAALYGLVEAKCRSLVDRLTKPTPAFPVCGDQLVKVLVAPTLVYAVHPAFGLAMRSKVVLV